MTTGIASVPDKPRCPGYCLGLAPISASERLPEQLAKREPHGPTDEEISALADEHWDEPMNRVDLWGFARAVLARWGRPAIESEELPPGYIDAEHAGHEREMLDVFYRACRSEGGTADEIHLRGLRAVLRASGDPGVADFHVMECSPCGN